MVALAAVGASFAFAAMSLNGLLRFGVIEPRVYLFYPINSQGTELGLGGVAK